MVISKKSVYAVVYACMAMGAYNSASAATISAWNFNSLAVATNTTPAASSGAGSASTLGMTYAGATDISDIVVGSNTTNEWRVRGGNSTTNPNGWNNSAPQYSQGVQFLTATTGYSNVVFSFDWITTTKSVRDLQEQYTVDGSNWINIGALQLASSTSYQTLSIDFGALGITAADNNANFGIRLVSAYDPTYTSGNAYTQQSSPTTPIGSSGNWRFDNISFSGTVAAVPEPESLSLFAAGLGLLGWVARRRNAV